MTDLTHAVNFLQATYMVLLGLAFGEAFKQFVPDSDKPIAWQRLPSLMAFLFMIFPFLHGMSRHFYTTYLNKGSGALAFFAGHLMFDGVMFIAIAALFFVMSRSLSQQHWKRFYIALLFLLLVDSTWIIVSMRVFGLAHLKAWLVLDICLAGVLLAVMGFVRAEDARLPGWVCATTTFVTCVIAYIVMSDFYFPEF